MLSPKIITSENETAFQNKVADFIKDLKPDQIVLCEYKVAIARDWKHLYSVMIIYKIDHSLTTKQ